MAPIPSMNKFVSLQCLAGALLLTQVSLAGEGASLQRLHREDRIVPNSHLRQLRGEQWIFATSDNERVETARPVRWGQWRGLVDQQAVWLMDGSWIAGRLQGRTADGLLIQNAWLDVMEIPITSIRAVLVSPAASITEWVEMQQQLDSIRGEDDVIWLRDRSRLAGVVDWPQMRGEDLDRANDLRTAISVQLPGGVAEISWSDVRLIAFSPTLLGKIPENRSTIRMGLEDGTLLNASSIENRGDHVAIRIPGLPELKSYDSSELLIRAIDFLGTNELSRATRTDQLEPISYRFLADSELEFPLGVNQSIDGLPMIVGHGQRTGILFHGLAMHSSSQVAYSWDQSPGRFLAEVRLASSAEEYRVLGDAVCKVLAAKQGKLLPLVEFSLGRQADQPDSVLVDVDITDAQMVVLMVEKGRLGQWGDQVYWLDARFSRN
jgi:hypothetical protein